MVVRRKKKNVKHRGHTTHGWGSRKKHRGAGSRGGRGRAGTGKRAGHKKAGMAPCLGSRGFLPRRSQISGKTVNLAYFNPIQIKKLIEEGKAKKEGDMVILDLSQLGYVKLLGTGTCAAKLKIKVALCSAGAAEKVKAAGGEVTVSDSRFTTPGKNDKAAKEVAKEE